MYCDSEFRLSIRSIFLSNTLWLNQLRAMSKYVSEPAVAAAALAIGPLKQRKLLNRGTFLLPLTKAINFLNSTDSLSLMIELWMGFKANA